MMNEDSNYINLHTTGRGELRRARKVTARGGKPYIAVDAHLFSKDVKRYFQLNVAGRGVKEIFPELEEAINDRNRVVEADLWIGDIEARSFQNGNNEIRHVIFGRLIGIEHVKIS